MNRLPFNSLLAGNPMNQARFVGPFTGAGANLAAFNNRAGILGEYVHPVPAFQVPNAIAGRLNHPGGNNFHMVSGMPLLEQGFNQQKGRGDFNPLGNEAAFQQSAGGRGYDQSRNHGQNEDDSQSYNNDADDGRGYGNQTRNGRGFDDSEYDEYDDNLSRSGRRRGEEDDGNYEMPSTNFQDYMEEDPANGREQRARDREKRGERRERRSRWEDVDSPRSERRDSDRRGGGRERRESRRDDRHDDERDRRDRDRDRDRRDGRGRRDDRDRQRDRRDEGRGDTSFGNEDNDSQDSGHRDRDYRDYRDSDRGSRGRDRDNDRDDRDRGRGGDWRQDRPSDTILLRSLPMFVNEAHIQTALMSFDGTAKDVRHMKRRETGASRGFAFVEFHNVQDAQRWMEQNKGQLFIEGQRVFMHYSHSRERNMEQGGPGGGADTRHDPNKGDWICSKCGAHNFKRREFCFKCNISREESEKTDVDDGSDQVGTNPCNTLLFRGLDALSTEESLQSRLTALSSTTPKNVLVIRDPLTNVSKSFAFVELHSVMASTQLLELLTAKNTPFELDGKLILVDYAKNTFSTVMASLNASNYQDYAQYYNQSYDGYYDQSQYYDYASYYSGYDVTQQAPPADPKAANQADSTNAAAAVAQAAMKQVKAAKDFHKQVHGQPQKQQQQQQHAVVSTEQKFPTQQPAPPGTSSSKDEYPKYPVPDVSTYQYDETSGYYYDPQTTLYYDANSQYYYNATTGQFMYWDGEKSTYLPAPTNSEGGSADASETGEKGGEHRDKKEKAKMAKKIAKDMEKWAKSMNAQKESVKERERRLVQMTTTKKESATADAGYSILEKAKTDAKLMPPPPGPLAAAVKSASPPNSALVGDYGGDSDSEEEPENGSLMSDPGVIDENKYLDWDKSACLLCKRQFPSKDALQRHQQLSDLHKQNLASLYKARGSAQGETLQAGSQYRDRAKERRQKYGTAAPPEPKRGRMPAPPIPHEEPNKEGIPQDNRGNKLLQKMGWSEGSGLGAKRQGIVDPIMAQRRQAGAGLGARGSSYGAVAGDTYKDTVKKMMAARFQDFDS